MIKCFCLTIVMVACLLGVGRTQEEDRGSVIAQKIALREKNRDEVLRQALARRDFKGFVAHIRARGQEAIEKQAGQKARRWPVERTHSWMNRFRRLRIRWAKKERNYLAMLHFVCGLISSRAAGLFG